MMKPDDTRIPFNVPYDGTAAFNEIMANSFEPNRLFSGEYASKVRNFFKEKYKAQGVFLTSACTRALELVALLLNIEPGDEVIVPSYTYVSSANAFEMYGAKVRFCDSCEDSPNLDIRHLETLITAKTKAIVVVHYAALCVDMDAIVSLARKHGLILIEDAAQGIDASYNDKPLGSFGDFAVFSFHETKNVSCGQGGALLVNNPAYLERAVVLKNVGTNRHRFMLGLEDKYTWIDCGSVFNLPEICCAYLYPQLENLQAITRKRIKIWEQYYNSLKPLAELGLFKLPHLESTHQHNGHIFYLTLRNSQERNDLLQYLNDHGIVATFHYVALHQSPYFTKKYGAQDPLPNAEMFSDCLLRLPVFYSLSQVEQQYIIHCVCKYFEAEKQQAKQKRPVRELSQMVFYSISHCLDGLNVAAVHPFICSDTVPAITACL